MGTEVGGDRPGVPGLVLRPERPADARAVALAHLAAFRAGHAGILADEVLDRLDAEAWVRRRRVHLADPDPDMDTLIADVGGVVVGHITYGRDSTDPDRTAGRIWACYLHPDWWGSGVADAMMRTATDAIPHREVRIWMLEGNHRAGRFYQRHGFQPDGARDEYRPPGRDLGYPIVRLTLHRPSLIDR